MRCEGKRRNVNGNLVAANVSENACAGGSEACLDIAHRDRKTCRWTKTTRSNGADLATGFIKKASACADRLAAFRLQANALGRCALGDCVQHGLRAVECSLFSHRLADRPGKTCRNRIGFRCDVLTMEAETGFEAQGIAGRKADPFDALIGE